MNPRRPRHTQPQATRLGLFVEYADLLRHLIAAEVRGRVFLHAQSQQPDVSPYLRDADIYALHAAAFGELYDWAGLPRRHDAGPGGIVHVPHYEVRVRLRELGEDFRAWHTHLPSL